MATSIGATPQDSHTLTLEGLDELVEEKKLLAVIRGSLNMTQLWNMPYYDEPVPVGEGQKFTVTKEGYPDADEDPTPPPSQTYGIIGIDGGLTPIIPGYEQFDIYMYPFRETTDYRMSNSKVSNLNKITSRIRNLSKKMARTLNKQYRRPLTIAAQFGHAYVTADDSDTALLTAAVSNLAGFHKNWVAGVETVVSSSNKIRATVKHSTDTFLIDVTAVSAGTRDDATDLTPGTITFEVLTGNADYTDGPITALSEGDPVVAIQASVIKRPGNKSSSWALGTSDTVTLDHVIDLAASMMSNGVEPDYRYGRILGLAGYKAWAALMKDNDFKTVYQDRFQSDEFKAGATIDIMNCLLMFGHETPDIAKSDGVNVRHILFFGNEAAARGVYSDSDPRGNGSEQTDPYIDVGNQYDIMFDPASQIKTVIRKPIDRGADVVSITMEAVLGMSAAPDTLAGDWCENPDAAFKRIASIEFRA